MGHARNPKSAAAHSTALSHVSSLSACALVGRTQTPETRPVVVCAYQATNIEPCGRPARTRHWSRRAARFSHCLAGGWTTNRPGRSEGETRAKASTTTSLAVFAERSPPRQAYRGLQCECSPGPVHRVARRCVADGRSGSRHSRPGGHQWVRESRPPRSLIRPCCTPSFGPCPQLCLCAPMCRHSPQRCRCSPISWARLCAWRMPGRLARESLRKRRGGPQAPPCREPPRNPVTSRYNRCRSRGPTAGVRRLARRLAARP